ncbi:MAG: aminoacyl-tRNA hydrolase [Candidatus Omnitrophica bacterium CG1_02_46_14]|nr:MAG: aminoacyl-tRNA hydrolase [Candidatus Omnitrophica bacterium CG1_02_46_14]
MKIVLGIGNPGKAYEKTRHNIGFQVLDRLAERLDSGLSARSKWRKDNKLHAEFKLKNEAVLVRPFTFVNLSGESAQAITKKYSVPPKDFLIVCDDVNLTFGKMRLRNFGSAGGHHGLESVIEHLGSDEFSRLRVGVGNEAMPKDLTSFVLESFGVSEKRELEFILDKAVLVCETWINKGFESAREGLSRLQSVKNDYTIKD